MTMFRKPRKPKKLNPGNNNTHTTEFAAESGVQADEETIHSDFSTSLEANLAYIQQEVPASPDRIIRRFFIGFNHEVEAALVYIDGLTDKRQIENNILRPLMTESRKLEINGNLATNIEFFQKKLITAGDVQAENSPEKALISMLAGDTLLIVDGFPEVLIISTRSWAKRSVEEPDAEVVIKGPHDGFTETLRDNTALIRRKLGHPDLVFESLTLGRKSKTDVCIAYLPGVADKNYVVELKKRLSRIDTDGILAAGFVEQFIEDAPFSIFPTVGYSERPDVVTAKILEGRIAMIIDGTPVVNTVPLLFMENFQSPDDYNFRPFFSTLIRWIRFISFGLTVLSPAVYVALTNFHQELLPTKLLISMAATKEGTPFPAVVEVILMGLVFEILREAGIRLPRPIGQAVSIVGALVIGEAAVEAGLVGAPTIIVIALTAISSFVVPTLAPVSIILRLFLTMLAGFLGAIGIITGLIVTLLHSASLRSLGVPYLTPLAPLAVPDLKDILVRAPIWALSTRPKYIGWKNPHRQGASQMPHAPSSRESEPEDHG
jgi:spore germination protein KA